MTAIKRKKEKSIAFPERNLNYSSQLVRSLRYIKMKQFLVRRGSAEPGSPGGRHKRRKKARRTKKSPNVEGYKYFTAEEEWGATNIDAIAGVHGGREELITETEEKVFSRSPCTHPRPEQLGWGGSWVLGSQGAGQLGGCSRGCRDDLVPMPAPARHRGQGAGARLGTALLLHFNSSANTE